MLDVYSFQTFKANCQILQQPLHNQVISFGSNSEVISLIIYMIFSPLELPLITLPLGYCAAWDAGYNCDVHFRRLFQGDRFLFSFFFSYSPPALSLKKKPKQNKKQRTKKLIFLRVSQTPMATHRLISKSENSLGELYQSFCCQCWVFICLIVFIWTIF